MKYRILILALAAGGLAFAQESQPLQLPNTQDDNPAPAPAETSDATLPSEPPAEAIDVAPVASPSNVTPTVTPQAAAAVARMRDAYIQADAPDIEESAPVMEPISPLDQVTPLFRVSEKPIQQALRILGRPHGVSFVVAPDAREAIVSADMRDATLREALMSILEPEGLHYEERAGYVTVRRNRTEYYIVSYPALKRTSSGSVSVNLAASQNSQNGSNGNTSFGGSSVATGGSNGQQGNQQDQATLSIEKEMDVDVWEAIEEMIQSQLHEGETLQLNRFTGIAVISASDRRHEILKPFVDLLNRRINQQVHIQARIIEVNLTSQSKLGVDWQQALTAAGTSPGDVNFQGNALSDLDSAGPNTLAPNTFNLRIGAGKLTAVISALAKQGNLRTESQPSITTLVNQTTYIKVGEDRTFFSLSSSTSINQPSSGNDTNVTSLDTYDRFSQTFGNVLEVTPSVGDDGVITLIVSPVISRFKGLTTSPDGRQSGPDTDSKATESIIRLRSGETGVLGGFVFTEDAKDRQGVPLLSKIPALGQAFRTDAVTQLRSELVIFITATLDPI